MIAILVALAMPLAGPKLTLDWEWRAGQGSVLSLAKDPERPYLFVATNEGGVVVLRSESRPQGPRVAATIPKSRLAGLDATTLVLDGQKLYIALGNFFNPRGSKYGLACIDISRPEEPKISGLWTSPSSARGASGLALRGDTLAMGLMSKGVAFFDVHDSANVRPISTFKPNPDFPVKNPREPHVPNARGLTFAGDLLFVANDAGGLRVLDCHDPATPVELSHYAQSAMLRKQQAYNNVVLDGTLAYLAIDYAGIEILNTADPKIPAPVSWWNPWHADRPSNIWFNSQGHTNQVALDRNRHWLYASAGDSELVVLDVADPRQPKLVSQYGRPGNGLGTWALELSGDHAYLSYIVAIVPFRGTWSGVKALKIG